MFILNILGQIAVVILIAAMLAEAIRRTNSFPRSGSFDRSPLPDDMRHQLKGELRRISKWTIENIR